MASLFVFPCTAITIQAKFIFITSAKFTHFKYLNVYHAKVKIEQVFPFTGYSLDMMNQF